MNFRQRRYLMTGIFSVIIVIIFTVTTLVTITVVDDNKAPAPQPVAVSALSRVVRVTDHVMPLARASAVPVLVYHEMDNACAASAPVCNSHDYESVSTAQFTAEMGWMYANGYHTVTLPQYLAWLADKKTTLPAKPFLITVDNGIGNFLEGAQPVLYHYRYTAAAFIVTGFADGAARKCAPHIGGVNVQPQCPYGDIGWDLTWPQIKALSPAVYNFGIEAGANGHYQQDYNKKCYAFDACKLPKEGSAAYEKRVRAENSNGITELESELGNRFDKDAWVVPYSDLGYSCGKAACSSFEGYDGPKGWLVSYAASAFHAAFVQDPSRNGVRNERFRFEVHALTTLPDFTAAIRMYTAAGFWNWK